MIALRHGATELTHEDYMEGILEVQAKKKANLQYYAWYLKLDTKAWVERLKSKQLELNCFILLNGKNKSFALTKATFIWLRWGKGN